MMRFEWEFQGATPDSTLLGWRPSGKRITRGLYRTANGQLINADCNGSGNIIRKAIQRGLGRGCGANSIRPTAPWFSPMSD